MTEKANENANSQNGENEEIVIEGIQDDDNLDVLKEKYQKLTDSNKQLFARTKKAEGFELKEGKWVKAPKENKPNPTEHKEPEAKSGELDYGQKAYLVANGIKGSDETALVKDIMANTGKTLDEVIESKYFQSELKEMRDDKASKDAIPNGSKRAGQSSKDSVEYWIAKGELPPADQRELRQKVVNAKLKSQTDGNPFTKNPVVQ